ncbi:MAG TPA: MFS transporter [Steroidobacteraceae bacterium]|nr:MFS transporter [Steroidobacteraceae bacterium]
MLQDRTWLYVAVLARSLATGMIGVLLGLYLAELKLSPSAIGVVVGAGLAGAMVATAVVTFWSDRFGHRRALMAVTALTVCGACLLAISTSPWALAFAAFVGMANGMGRDRGAALVVEQAALPATTTDLNRTMIFAKYNVLQDIGHAFGSLLAALPVILEASLGTTADSAQRASIWVYAVLCAVPLIAYARLSGAVEATRVFRQTRLSPESRRTLAKISGLFAIDSLAGGFLTTALLAYFFHERFGVDASGIGLLFFIARIANAGSHFAAAWLARHVGLVNTMVFTHIPSSLLLLTVPFMPDFETAAILFLLRESLVEMDVPTRQSYVMAVVQPDERTFASGMTHLVRLAGWASAPAFAGLLMAGQSLAMPIYVGAAMKIFYDLALWQAFRKVKPPEEKLLEA